jgi:hypothetical protein
MRNSTPAKRPAALTPAQEPRNADIERRRFLFALGVGGAGAAVAVVSALPETAGVEIAAASPNDEDSRYRETAHVRDYYRTAKI